MDKISPPDEQVAFWIFLLICLFAVLTSCQAQEGPKPCGPVQCTVIEPHWSYCDYNHDNEYTVNEFEITTDTTVFSLTTCEADENIRMFEENKKARFDLLDEVRKQVWKIRPPVMFCISL